MKKILIYICIFLLPINIYAYSDKVILGGQNIGISINSKGILVVGFYKVNNTYNTSKLIIGDYITKVGEVSVNTIEELVNEINKQVNNNKVEITYLRENKEYKTTISLEKVNSSYKTGIYVKDNIIGNGTLTYIDPTTNIYGALGHYILDNNTSSPFLINNGSIFKSIITDITKSINGNPGSINTKFYKNIIYGNINKNSEVGIYGNYTSSIDTDDLISIASIDEVEKGKAYIVTSLDNKVSQYEIEILRIDTTSNTKNLYFKIVDKDLINKSGGIVQGMSGSPIIQNNKLIGAVTHVTIDDVTIGYGVSIINMLEEGEKN